MIDDIIMDEKEMDVRASNEVDDETSYSEAKDKLLDPFLTINKVLAINRAEVQKLENQMQIMRQILVDDMDARLNKIMSEVIQQLQKDGSKKNKKIESDDDKKTKSTGKILEKQFASRNSYLTDLFEINHIQTVYNMVFVMLLILFLKTALHDYIETGTIRTGFEIIKYALGNVINIALIWSIVTTLTFFTYLGFSLWSRKHINFVSKYNESTTAIRILDYGSLITFIAFQIVFLVVPAKLTIDYNLPPVASLIILMEQVRMLMKVYAFVRSNVPRVLIYKCNNEDVQGINCPEFSKFVYFMFAPTLIYRDEYPRTKSIRWQIVLRNFAEVSLVIFYSAFMFECFIIPPFEKYGTKIFEPQFVITTIFNAMLPATITYLFGFYCILHAWQNGMAELLRFGDRLFYKDWWNSRSFGEFFRLWNTLVHDWLHQYIYKDVYDITRNKVYATLVTFILSAIFHEYILIIALRFFYPVMFLSFAVFGVFLVYLMKKYPKTNGNIHIWLNIFIGQGIIYTLYSMEFYARMKCPPYTDQWSDMLLPRSWVCHNIINGTVFIS